MDVEVPKAPEQIPAALEPLYARVREYRQDYEKGLALSGDSNSSAAARIRLSVPTCG